MLEREPQVEQHPHGDEEDACEGVAEGQHVRQRLHAVLRFRNHEAGDERTERQ